MISLKDIEKDIAERAYTILNGVGSGDGVSLFDKNWWYGQIMDWSMKKKDFKTRLFHFIDVFPCLHSGSDVIRHLKEYFADSKGKLPSVFGWGISAGALAPNLLSKTVKKNITQMGKMFIVGQTPKEALPILLKNWGRSIAFTVDLLGEVAVSEKEAEDYQDRYLKIIQFLGEDSKNWKDQPLLNKDHLGSLPLVNVSVKITSIYSQINTSAWEDTLAVILKRLRPLFREAMKYSAFINIDMEHYAYKDIFIEAFCRIVQEEEFSRYPHWGIVIQAYLRDSLSDIDKVIRAAERRKLPLTIRLVKGAYWDYEIIHADQKRWPLPVYMEKWESDWNYERCALKIMENHRYLKCAVGSHNVRSIAACLVIAEKINLPPEAIEIQMLFGMASSIKNYLLRENFRIREYAPIGELIPGMAYLVRRLLENTSNESFLRSRFVEKQDAKKLAENTGRDRAPSSPQPPEHPDFLENVANLDFTLKENRSRMEQALEAVKRKLGRSYALDIGGKKVKTKKTFSRFDPAFPDRLIGTIGAAGKEEADRAVSAAQEAFSSWSRTPPEQRAQTLERLANLIEKNRFELMAWEIFEVGKSWTESDGDICEAIDFCRYYAEQMRKLMNPSSMTGLTGETSVYHHIPRGVSLVIAPWNFPLAILTGLVVANAVTGNTVVMKPAEQSSVVAAQLMRLVQEAGFPKGVIQYLPGIGEEVGAYLVKHPGIYTITFTGSRAVGLDMIQKASILSPGQRHVKNCVIEMGGKNALIIDSDADMDEAVGGAVYSAFGFQGQKCSACSRVIVMKDIYEKFISRLVEAVKSLAVLPAEDPRCIVGPVVDEEAYRRILKTIEQGKKNARFLYSGTVPEKGWFVPPTLFADVAPDSPLAQEEIFGPVLSILHAADLEEALKIANDVDYALTGGIYSRSPVHIARAKENMEVGNFYVNRPITGSIVNRHPFGGFKLSGIGNKAGGPDYLQQFMHARVITENTMRRGFAPELV